MTAPQTSVDWPAVLLGVVGTLGAVVALIQGAWLWAAVIFLGSILAEMLVVSVRRRKSQRV